MHKTTPSSASVPLAGSNDGSPPGPSSPSLPALCGDIDIRIAADGTWYYGGSPIGRKELVCLFASVLVHDCDGYWLQTPAERARIQVDDVPFAAVEVTKTADGLSIRTNVDDIVTADDSHPLRMGARNVPYVTVRPGLDARFTRAAYYDLVALGVFEQRDGQDVFGVWSRETFFPLGAPGDGDAP